MIALIVCNILLVVGNPGEVHFMTKASVEGKILATDNSHYLVDFTEGVKKYPLADGDYSKVLVNRTDCVKE